LDTTDPKIREKILDVLSDTSIVINRWITYEVDFMQNRKSAILDEMGKLGTKLAELYQHGLEILGSIHACHSTRLKRAGMAYYIFPSYPPILIFCHKG
jgi:hypothetical protein